MITFEAFEAEHIMHSLIEHSHKLIDVLDPYACPIFFALSMRKGADGHIESILKDLKVTSELLLFISERCEYLHEDRGLREEFLDTLEWIEEWEERLSKFEDYERERTANYN